VTLRKTALIIVASVIVLVAIVVAVNAPAIAAGALLHPYRWRTEKAAPAGCVDTTFEGAGGIRLRGWKCAPPSAAKGTLVYLHGVADNRGSGSGIVTRFVNRGLEVIAYDSRAHGDSEGDMCTYGFHEKEDLKRVITAIGRDRVVMLGHSLGAAIALQAAAEDPRIVGVVAAESFSDLRTVAGERAFYLPAWLVAKAFRYAEEKGIFDASSVSPERAAAHIKVPVLVIHGTADDATSPEHSERIHAALPGPKKLMLVDGARHAQSLARPEVWDAIEKWIHSVVSGQSPLLATDY
jgi:alpha-beta hydrolase superfamily lysophospholipase